MTTTEPTTTASPTTAEMLLEYDRRRPRSQQREFGMSELGGCRRRAGYRLAGTTPTNQGSSVQAVMGTAVHTAVEGVFRAMQDDGLIPPEDLVEHEVHFAGIKGHLDRYEAATATLTDVKTTSSRWLEHIKEHGPSQQHVWQVNGYAAALIAEGHKVRRIVIDYLARDTGEEYRWTGRFDPQYVRDALEWVDQVRNSELDMLPRDYAPESSFCRHCPFRDTCWDGHVPNRDLRSVLYVESPDGTKWAGRLDQARRDKADATAREAEAKGALDALRPNTSGKSDAIDVGYDKCLQWTVSVNKRLDTKQVRAEYAQAGASPPETVGESTTLKFVPRGDAGGQ